MTPVLTILGIVLDLLVWGSHAVIPWRVARAAEDRRRLWGLCAFPLLLAALIASLVRWLYRPDALIAAGLADPLHGPAVARVVLILLAAAVAADLIILVGWRRLDVVGWKLAASLSTCGLLAYSLLSETLRAGGVEVADLGPFLLAVAARGVLAVGLLDGLSHPRPWATWSAAVALPLYLFALPSEARANLWAGGDVLTLIGAALLLASAGWLPSRYRIPSLLAATLLTAAFLARVEAVAATLSQASPLL
jgi:hypothetical protein